MEAFVVRVWVPGPFESGGPPDDGLHGVVEHVVTGEAIPFRDVDELASILSSRTAHLEPRRRLS